MGASKKDRMAHMPMRRNALNAHAFLSVWAACQESNFKPSVSDQFHAAADTHTAQSLPRARGDRPDEGFSVPITSRSPPRTRGSTLIAEEV